VVVVEQVQPDKMEVHRVQEDLYLAVVGMCIIFNYRIFSSKSWRWSRVVLKVVDQSVQLEQAEGEAQEQYLLQVLVELLIQVGEQRTVR
jgi:hypothetical protein